jgi:hypothetical protein
MAKKTNQTPVLVTTEFRGVFFGYIKDDKKAPEQITLTGVRNCIYWSVNCGGFLGLAANGPNKDCRIGARVDEVTLYKITSVTPVQDAAVKAWESV